MNPHPTGRVILSLTNPHFVIQSKQLNDSGKRVVCRPELIRSILACLPTRGWGDFATMPTLIDVHCFYCGKPLKRERFELKEHPRHFCSNEHRGKWMSTRRGKDHPSSVPHVKLECDSCHSPLERSPSYIKKHNFCNQRCHWNWNIGRYCGENNPHWHSVHVECAYCHKPLIRQANQKKEHHRHFCNHECKGLWMSEHIRGKAHPRYIGGITFDRGPNWQRQKTAARKRDDYTCQYCGIHLSMYTRQLDVHHLRPFREYGYISGQNKNYREANRLDNLISLCKRDHALAEVGKIVIQPKLL